MGFGVRGETSRLHPWSFWQSAIIIAMGPIRLHIPQTPRVKSLQISSYIEGQGVSSYISLHIYLYLCIYTCVICYPSQFNIEGWFRTRLLDLSAWHIAQSHENPLYSQLLHEDYIQNDINVYIHINILCVCVYNIYMVRDVALGLCPGLSLTWKHLPTSPALTMCMVHSLLYVYIKKKKKREQRNMRYMVVDVKETKKKIKIKVKT